MGTKKPQTAEVQPEARTRRNMLAELAALIYEPTGEYNVVTDSDGNESQEPVYGPVTVSDRAKALAIVKKSGEFQDWITEQRKRLENRISDLGEAESDLDEAVISASKFLSS